MLRCQREEEDDRSKPFLLTLEVFLELNKIITDASLLAWLDDIIIIDDDDDDLPSGKEYNSSRVTVSKSVDWISILRQHL